MFNEIIEITEITWNQNNFKWFRNLVQDFLKCRTPRWFQWFQEPLVSSRNFSTHLHYCKHLLWLTMHFSISLLGPCHPIKPPQSALTICTGFSVFCMAKKKPCGKADLAISCHFVTVFWIVLLLWMYLWYGATKCISLVVRTWSVFSNLVTYNMHVIINR